MIREPKAWIAALFWFPRSYLEVLAERKPISPSMRDFIIRVGESPVYNRIKIGAFWDICGIVPNFSSV